MKNLIYLEEIVQFLLANFLFNSLNYPWWWFLALLLTPTFTMLGYLAKPKIGLWVYNLVYYKGLAILL